MSEEPADRMLKPTVLGFIAFFLLVPTFVAADFIPKLFGLNADYQTQPLLMFVVLRAAISALSPAPPNFHEKSGQVAFLVSQAQGLATLCFSYSLLKLAISYHWLVRNPIEGAGFSNLGQDVEKAVLIALGALAFLLMWLGLSATKKLRKKQISGETTTPKALLLYTLIYTASGYMATLYIVVAIPTAGLNSERIEINIETAGILTASVLIAFLITFLGDLASGLVVYARRTFTYFSRSRQRTKVSKEGNTIETSNELGTTEKGEYSGVDDTVPTAPRARDLALTLSLLISFMRDIFAQNSERAVAFFIGATLLALLSITTLTLLVISGFAIEIVASAIVQAYQWSVNHPGATVAVVASILGVILMIPVALEWPRIRDERLRKKAIRDHERSVASEEGDIQNIEQKLAELQASVGEITGTMQELKEGLKRKRARLEELAKTDPLEKLKK